MSDVAIESLRVLVVDDDPDQRFLFRRLAIAAGIVHLAEATGADDALRQVIDFAPDLIVLDLEMPGRSGLEVLPELLLAAEGVRVIVLSNVPRARLGSEALARGALGFVEKRTPPDRLISELLFAAMLIDATTASTSFPAETSSPRSARAFVREVLEQADADLLATTELLVSELVANAVEHAASSPRVDVRVSRSMVRIEVYDRDPALPNPRKPDPTTPHGRGLLLVDRTSSRWGAEPHPPGKVVWFELDRTPPT